MDAGAYAVPVRATRKFGLLDAMILVAVLALWSAVLRYFGPATNWGNWVSIWVFSGGGWSARAPGARPACCSSSFRSRWF